ncbi:OLC1v1037821C1 [Oldenlandia corymbosa var. corymbosa]|uniref:OLC1v1037821C1 n=1 Tax=Oldenlandia corymbosa var. corymbosa TaxID=529605 RepID=A0AAV1CZH9_OLDCO|nr:OLC1v1037821C1 [Oldenlandia corymbosa var. corymbosa]
MGLSKTEVNLRRLLAAAPQQQNQTKLLHYVSTLREQLEQLAEEKTSEGLPRVSKALLNEYSGKIEAIAARLAVCEVEFSEEISQEHSSPKSGNESPSKAGDIVQGHEGLRRRLVPPSISEDVSRDITEADQASPVKLDAAAQMHIQKHRKLQEDLTDEMVDLARQLKERSILMNQSVKNTEKLLDSTEKAVEHSLASTERANTRAVDIYSKSSKTSCLTWLLMFAMTFIFLMVILLIRVT